MLLHGDIWFGFIIKLIIIRKYGDNINYALIEVFTRFTNLNEFCEILNSRYFSDVCNSRYFAGTKKDFEHNV